MSGFDENKKQAQLDAEQYANKKWVVGQQAVCKDGYMQGRKDQHAQDAVIIERLKGFIGPLVRAASDRDATIEKLEARIGKLREALLNVAEDTSPNTDFYLQHTAQEALNQDEASR